MKRLTLCLLALMLLLPAAHMQQDSWAHINQEIVRREGWTDFVADTAFPLGERSPYPGQDGLSLGLFGRYPSLDGSTVCVPLGLELARQHLNMDEKDLSGFVTFSTTHSAYARLIGKKPNPSAAIPSQKTVMDPAHPIDLILVTAPSDEEQRMAKEEGVNLVMTPFCYDAFVFLVNSQNPVSNLSTKQIQRIYSGQVVDWGEVGGTRQLPLEAYQRPKNSGSQTAMENMVMQGVRLKAEENYISDGMGDLVAQVGNYTNGERAIGYSYLYYVDALYKSGNIKTLSVDGIAPSQDNLQSGAYPFTVCYYAVYRKGDTNTGRFVDWLVSEEGQQCVQQAGYIPLKGK